jgi:hypothetical protein
MTNALGKIWTGGYGAMSKWTRRPNGIVGKDMVAFHRTHGSPASHGVFRDMISNNQNLTRALSGLNPSLIWEELCGPGLKAYLIKKCRYQKEAGDQIDWRAMKRAMTLLIPTGQP